MHLDRTELPSKNILDRWRKDVVEDENLENNATEESKSIETAAYIHKKLMVKSILSMAGVEGGLDESGYKEAMEGLDKIISTKATAAGGGSAGISGNELTRPTSCPPRPS